MHVTNVIWAAKHNNRKMFTKGKANLGWRPRHPPFTAAHPFQWTPFPSALLHNLLLLFLPFSCLSTPPPIPPSFGPQQGREKN